MTSGEKDYREVRRFWLVRINFDGGTTTPHTVSPHRGPADDLQPDKDARPPSSRPRARHPPITGAKASKTSEDVAGPGWPGPCSIRRCVASPFVQGGVVRRLRRRRWGVRERTPSRGYARRRSGPARVPGGEGSARRSSSTSRPGSRAARSAATSRVDARVRDQPPPASPGAWACAPAATLRDLGERASARLKAAAGGPAG